MSPRRSRSSRCRRLPAVPTTGPRDAQPQPLPRPRGIRAAHGEVAQRVLDRVGGRVLWHTPVNGTVIGEGEERFDDVIAVWYPSAAAFLQLVADPGAPRRLASTGSRGSSAQLCSAAKAPLAATRPHHYEREAQPRAVMWGGRLWPRSDGEAGLNQLEEDHLGGVGPPRAELDDPGVAARALRVARRDLLEQLVDRRTCRCGARERLAPGVQIPALGERDQLLELRLAAPSPSAEWSGCARARSAASTSCEASVRDAPRPGSAWLSCAGASSRSLRPGLWLPSPAAARGRVRAGSPGPPRSTCDRSSGSR